MIVKSLMIFSLQQLLFRDDLILIKTLKLIFGVGSGNWSVSFAWHDFALKISISIMLCKLIIINYNSPFIYIKLNNINAIKIDIIRVNFYQLFNAVHRCFGTKFRLAAVSLLSEDSGLLSVQESCNLLPYRPELSCICLGSFLCR
jgi:hypothetical protein